MSMKSHPKFSATFFKFSFNSFEQARRVGNYAQNLRLLEITEPNCSRDILITYKRNKADNARVEKFYNFLTEYFKKCGRIIIETSFTRAAGAYVASRRLHEGKFFELAARAAGALQKEMRNARMDYAFKIFGDFFYLDGAAH